MLVMPILFNLILSKILVPIHDVIAKQSAPQKMLVVEMLIFYAVQNVMTVYHVAISRTIWVAISLLFKIKIKFIKLYKIKKYFFKLLNLEY
jgi:hypothetical protein